jgi:hypothetical protein
MSSALVVLWILGGNALALLLLNAVFSKGTSSMSRADTPSDRMPPAVAMR